jgi:hypothetical protein
LAKKTRQTGDRYRPVVTISKMKNGLPTVISVSGETYILVHKHGYDHRAFNKKPNKKNGKKRRIE